MGPSAHSTSCRASIVRIEIGRIEIGRIEIGRIERCCPRLEVSGMIAGTADPTPDVTTATKPTPAGGSASPYPARGYGDHPSTGFVWSTRAAPIP